MLILCVINFFFSNVSWKLELMYTFYNLFESATSKYPRPVIPFETPKSVFPSVINYISQGYFRQLILTSTTLLSNVCFIMFLPARGSNMCFIFSRLLKINKTTMFLLYILIQIKISHVSTFNNTGLLCIAKLCTGTSQSTRVKNAWLHFPRCVRINEL